MLVEQWRGEGWKCAPTAYQLTNTMDGVCRDCRLVLARRRYKPGPLLAVVFVVIAVFFALIAFLFLVTTPA